MCTYIKQLLTTTPKKEDKKTLDRLEVKTGGKRLYKVIYIYYIYYKGII